MLLGTLEDPLEPLKDCNMRDIIRGDSDTRACLCTTSFCNYNTDEREEVRSRQQKKFDEYSEKKNNQITYQDERKISVPSRNFKGNICWLEFLNSIF